MDRKLVSVVTGTYNRARLINQCIENVSRQDYPNIEHCIVSDGPDPLLRLWHETDWPEADRERKDIRIKFVETGRQWSHFLTMSISAVPYQVAQWLSSGDYIMWLADDEEITPDYISSLVDLLEEKDVDFVYSKTEVWFNRDACGLRPNAIIGEPTPRNGQITQALFRAELLDYRGFTPGVGSGTDWDQVDAWMKAGASWAFLDRVTHTHRVDKFGDQNVRKTKLLLRGNRYRMEESTKD